MKHLFRLALHFFQQKSGADRSAPLSSYLYRFDFIDWLLGGEALHFQIMMVQNHAAKPKCIYFIVQCHTLKARKPLIRLGLRAFLYALNSYVLPLPHQQICRLQADFRRDIGGT